MPATNPVDTNNPTAFDRAKYTVFEMRDKQPDGRVIVRNLPFCLVQLDGDDATQAFWMVPSPEGPPGADGHLGLDFTTQVLNVETSELMGTSLAMPVGQDASGPFAVFQWSDPSV